MNSNIQTLNLDVVDRQLLDALQTDCSITNLELAARVRVSPPTCLRRVKRLQDAGLIERQIAILDMGKLATLIGHGLQAIVEITLDRQDADALDAFELRIASDDAVQQCYRVSPGPDFVVHLYARDMPGYLAISQRLFTHDANVRNVKTFFVVKRSKFEPKMPLSQ